jgi:hypothetical protein
MLQGARAGDRAVLGDVADEQDRAAPEDLAAAMRAPATSRTWLTLPASPSTSALAMV